MAYTEKFVKYYVNLGWNKFSLDFFNTLKKYFPRKKFRYLDIACGAGVLAAKVATIKRANVDAFDISPAMIENAKKRSKKVNFFVADMTVFKKFNEYDIITCLYDSINHLKGFNKWEKFFKNAYFSLKKGGIFIFDYNNLRARENWQKEYITNINRYKIIQRGVKIKNGANLYIKIFYNNKKITEEKFVNFMYKDEDIKKAIRKTGFVIVEERQNELKTRNFLFCRH
jgi:SAM-dependent methyltransferase